MSGPDERLFRAFTHSISGLSFHSELGGSRVREEEGVVYFSHSTFPHTWNGPNLEKHPHAPGDKLRDSQPAVQCSGTPRQCCSAEVQDITCADQTQGQMNDVLETQRSQSHREKDGVRVTGEHQWA